MFNFYFLEPNHKTRNTFMYRITQSINHLWVLHLSPSIRFSYISSCIVLNTSRCNRRAIIVLFALPRPRSAIKRAMAHLPVCFHRNEMKSIESPGTITVRSAVICSLERRTSVSPRFPAIIDPYVTVNHVLSPTEYLFFCRCAGTLIVGRASRIWRDRDFQPYTWHLPRKWS